MSAPRSDGAGAPAGAPRGGAACGGPTGVASSRSRVSDGEASLHRGRRADRRRQDDARAGPRRALGAPASSRRSRGEPVPRAFYQDRQKLAFQTQLFFLLSRFQQQQALFQQDLFSRSTVTDYLFAKDRIFASLTLGPDELSRSTTASTSCSGRAS